MADVNLKITADNKQFRTVLKQSEALLSRFEKRAKRISSVNLGRAGGGQGGQGGTGGAGHYYPGAMPGMYPGMGSGAGAAAGAAAGSAAGAGFSDRKRFEDALRRQQAYSGRLMGKTPNMVFATPALKELQKKAETESIKGLGVKTPPYKMPGIARRLGGMVGMGLLAGAGFTGASSIANMIKENNEYEKSLRRMRYEAGLSTTQLLALDSAIKNVSKSTYTGKKDILGIAQALKEYTKDNLPVMMLQRLAEAMKTSGQTSEDLAKTLYDLQKLLKTTDPDKLAAAYMTMAGGRKTGYVSDLSSFPTSLLRNQQDISMLTKMMQLPGVRGWEDIKGMDIFKQGKVPVFDPGKVEAVFKKLGDVSSIPGLEKKNKELVDGMTAWEKAATNWSNELGPSLASLSNSLASIVSSGGLIMFVKALTDLTGAVLKLVDLLTFKWIPGTIKIPGAGSPEASAAGGGVLGNLGNLPGVTVQVINNAQVDSTVNINRGNKKIVDTGWRTPKNYPQPVAK